MKSFQPAISPPVAYAAEVAFELRQMRDECSNAAQAIANRTPLDEPALEACACLDDALAEAHKLLHAALKRIDLLRGR